MPDHIIINTELFFSPSDFWLSEALITNLLTHTAAKKIILISNDKSTFPLINDGQQGGVNSSTLPPCHMFQSSLLYCALSLFKTS